jgi:hypothetical protein
MIAVTLPGRASHVQQAGKMSARFQSLFKAEAGGSKAKAVLLKAEGVQDVTFDMLVRGFIPHVSVNKGPYLSLCKRTEKYEILKSASGCAGNPSWDAGAQEGFVGTDATTTHDSTTTTSTDAQHKDLHVVETLLTWGGGVRLYRSDFNNSQSMRRKCISG